MHSTCNSLLLDLKYDRVAYIGLTSYLVGVSPHLERCVALFRTLPSNGDPE